MYVHENNINTKINTNYNKVGNEIKQFKKDYYEPMRNKVESIDIAEASLSIFTEIANIFNDYRNNLHMFAQKYRIMSQSKFESTFLEEISYYLFRNLPLIKNGNLNIFNKGIYAGLKINNELEIDIIKKDVDFCIGKKIRMTIEKQVPIELIIPAVCVEVKTYLDATMFGEIKSSSKTLKSATPNSKAYVLMGHKELAVEHIIAARQDSTLDEMFVLQENADSPIDPFVLEQYYSEISLCLQDLANKDEIVVPGRLLKVHQSSPK